MHLERFNALTYLESIFAHPIPTFIDPTPFIESYIKGQTNATGSVFQLEVNKETYFFLANDHMIFDCATSFNLFQHQETWRAINAQFTIKPNLLTHFIYNNTKVFSIEIDFLLGRNGHPNET